MIDGKRGAIVNISSVMGPVGTLGASAYVASKHGLVGLTKARAREYESRNIRISTLATRFYQNSDDLSTESCPPRRT